MRAHIILILILILILIIMIIIIVLEVVDRADVVLLCAHTVPYREHTVLFIDR